MGIVIKKSQLNRIGQEGLLKPIVYCSCSDEMQKTAVSMNQPLAEHLMPVKSQRRAMKMENCFTTVLLQMEEPRVIKEFDVLFHPAYQIDVLQMMINVCKRDAFSIIWPGTYENGKLIYAEEGDMDYKVYNVEDYDITCVI